MDFAYETEFDHDHIGIIPDHNHGGKDWRDNFRIRNRKSSEISEIENKKQANSE